MSNEDMVIRCLNPETFDLEKSYTADPYSIGVTSIVVKNSDRFATNDRILLGEMGQEKSEIVTVSAVSADGMTLTIGATVFSHEADTPVYKLRFDQVKFYRSTTTVSGSYSLISTEDLDVDNADLETTYDDVNGLTTYYYKFTMYHSISGVESDYSDPMGGTGWRRNQVGNIIDEILQEIGDTNEIHMTRQELIGYFNDVNDDLTIGVAKPYTFLHTRTTLTRTAGRNYVDFPTDSNGLQTMWKFDRMDYNFTDSTTDATTTIPVIPMEEFRNIYANNVVDSTTETDNTPVEMTIDTAMNRFRFSSPFATTTSSVFYLYYWKFFDTIDSEGDEIETPTPKIYKLYCKAMYYRKRGITDPSYITTSDRYMGEYMVEKSKYKGIDRKDQGTPRSFRFESDTFRQYRR